LSLHWPQQETWNALNDPEVLKDCIPGCESITRVSDNEYDVVLTARVGPVSAKFKGRMKVTDADPPRAYTLGFEGQGGVAGFAKGEATVTLTPEGASTKLAYSAKATVGGKLAQVGARLIDGVARQLAGKFFEAFEQRAGGKAA
jgi:carbon monoxide dehydrogenase subunit G